MVILKKGNSIRLKFYYLKSYHKKNLKHRFKLKVYFAAMAPELQLDKPEGV